MRFFNKYLNNIYRYIEMHDGETILIKDMVKDLDISAKTIRKYIRFLVKGEIIKKTGKRFSIPYPDEE